MITVCIDRSLHAAFALAKAVQKIIPVLALWAIMPIAAYAQDSDGLYVDISLSSVELDTPYVSNSGASYNDNPGGGYTLSLGKHVGEDFSISGYYMKLSERDRYKVGELDGFARDLVEFLDPLFFGLLDTNLYVSVDTEIAATGLAVSYRYYMLTAKAGVMRWYMDTEITMPDGTNSSIGDDGYGYHYGVGLSLPYGRRWRYSWQGEQYHFDDLKTRLVSIGISYSF